MRGGVRRQVDRVVLRVGGREVPAEIGLVRNRRGRVPVETVYDLGGVPRGALELTFVHGARPGLSALVRGRALDLRARTALRARARGLSGAANPRAVHRDLDRVRPCNGAGVVAALSRRPAADGPGKRSRGARCHAAARARPARRAAAARRASPRPGQRLVRGVPRGLRAVLRRAAGRPGALARSGRGARVGRAPRRRLCLAAWPAS